MSVAHIYTAFCRETSCSLAPMDSARARLNKGTASKAYVVRQGSGASVQPVLHLAQHSHRATGGSRCRLPAISARRAGAARADNAGFDPRRSAGPAPRRGRVSKVGVACVEQPFEPSPQRRGGGAEPPGRRFTTPSRQPRRPGARHRSPARGAARPTPCARRLCSPAPPAATFCPRRPLTPTAHRLPAVVARAARAAAPTGRRGSAACARSGRRAC